MLFIFLAEVKRSEKEKNIGKTTFALRFISKMKKKFVNKKTKIEKEESDIGELVNLTFFFYYCKCQILSALSV